MNRDTLYENMEKQMLLQTKLLEESVGKTEKVKGSLYVRDSGKHKLYYQATKKKTKTGWKTYLKNISDKPDLIRKLAAKGINRKLKKIYKDNIKALACALKKYTPLNDEVLMPEKYKDVFVAMPENRPYRQCPFDSKVHIHLTAAGFWVRSKAEVIIANALWHYNIPFNYEELFPYASVNGDLYYPDFTIHLPDGRTLVWEHFGMLDMMEYCISNAGKIHTYHMAGFTIGKNFIITQDDLDGGIDSALVYHIIEEYILPYFK